ncbi:hypothetical protein [Bartonella doshiae]|uniref:Uncharacterized protein n=2 Tax=Bartonella doshiae TaxID=33044 RepID=A0A380ZFW6_BARDO|nr:hypothetical protein [Bartonella doshiae]EJF79944.1 hypothetical protein MCS_01285 [Bartonella doshiae NCTC 12862 = ATCC 700133]MBB6158950.1 hypothetical protein [Bartonella doshiae]SUV45511.1 Uncharacterised protein [Bartonella doshiae]
MCGSWRNKHAVFHVYRILFWEHTMLLLLLEKIREAFGKDEGAMCYKWGEELFTLKARSVLLQKFLAICQTGHKGFSAFLDFAYRL